jgi:chromosome segregation ATPase
LPPNKRRFATRMRKRGLDRSRLESLESQINSFRKRSSAVKNRFNSLESAISGLKKRGGGNKRLNELANSIRIFSSKKRKRANINLDSLERDLNDAFSMLSNISVGRRRNDLSKRRLNSPKHLDQLEQNLAEAFALLDQMGAKFEVVKKKILVRYIYYFKSAFLHSSLKDLRATRT